jgi:hypothetical protein
MNSSVQHKKWTAMTKLIVVWEAYMNEDPQDEQKYIYNTTARPVEMT